MSAPNRRRNRSLASCEPCRRCKIRCDHRRPICASCQRRGLHCWYHPAPLTKQSTSQNPRLLSSGISGRITRSDSRNTDGNCQLARNPSSGPPIFHTWPFMSADPSDSGPPLQGQTTQPGIFNMKSYGEHLASIESIISQLKLLPVVEQWLYSYYAHSQVPLVPKCLALQLVNGLKSCPEVSDYLKRRNSDSATIHHGPQLAKLILAASSTEVRTTPDLNLPAFCALFTGGNMRVETIGLLFTMAARSCLFSMRNGEEESQDQEFIRDMGWYGNLSLRLARELSPQTTDLMIWLAHENLQLTTHFEGDASLAVWRRVSDIATDILALGLNRETTYSATPEFLGQCRRRTFAKAYYLDQLYAAVFHRPPRITARHADCNLPLDLSDEDIFGSSYGLEKAKGRLTDDGWNTDGKHRTATWVRIRYILAEYREEIIEYQSRALGKADTINLRGLSGRCQQMWNSLPPHLQYKNECWTSLPPEHCYMHAKVYLSYLHIHFQAYHALNHLDGHASFSPELLEVSMDMLETVVHMTTRRSRSFSPLDLPGIVLTCGLPCAAILSTTLMNALQGLSGSLPSTVKVPNVIRQLSVLASQLETISSPNEINHAFCLKASKAISHKLDQILERSIPVVAAQTSTDIPQVISGDSTVDTFDDFDLGDWLTNFDVGTIFVE